MSDTVAEVKQPQDIARRGVKKGKRKRRKRTGEKKRFASSFRKIYIFNLSPALRGVRSSKGIERDPRTAPAGR